VAIVGLIKPFTIREPQTLQITAVFMLVALGLFFWFTKTKNKLSLTEAWLLLAFYVSFVVSQIVLLVR